MPAAYMLSDDGTYLIEHFLGHHTVPMQRTVLLELSAHVAQAGVRKVLVDIRAQRTPIGLTDGSQLWAELAWHLPWKTTFAIVVIAGHPTARFLEIIARLRGHDGRYFDDYEQARTWLRKV